MGRVAPGLVGWAVGFWEVVLRKHLALFGETSERAVGGQAEEPTKSTFAAGTLRRISALSPRTCLMNGLIRVPWLH